MTNEQRLKNLEVPTGKIDVVLDTDTFNEIDDQFALAYLLRSTEKLNTKAIYAAPFFNQHSTSPADGMERSYEEIKKVLALMNEDLPVFKGSDKYLPDERTAVDSPAADDLIARAKLYSPENPLYVVAIGAITNVASALIKAPEITENIVIVWLGGNSRQYHDTKEFNMMQDVAAARVVMSSAAPFVQLPCMGIVSSFMVSAPELEYWLMDKNPLADYLARNTIKEANAYASGKPWTRVIWDVTAVAWLLNENSRFMLSRIEKTLLPSYEHKYEENTGADMRYVYHIWRDTLMEDLIKKLTK
ncbi:MAG: nucleoside hydrolase [Clostridia bacterium]|nr:nucleoside hydrolase [Clostridia bacterium]